MRSAILRGPFSRWEAIRNAAHKLVDEEITPRLGETDSARNPGWPDFDAGTQEIRKQNRYIEPIPDLACDSEHAAPVLR